MLKDIKKMAEEFKEEVTNSKSTKKQTGPDKVVNTVKVTTNYDQFFLSARNREIKTPRKVIAAILDQGVLYPILVGKDGVIVDGQNRWKVCKTNNLPLPYIVDENVDESHITSLNNDRSGWKLKDYLFSHRKKAPYKLFAVMQKESGLSINSLYVLLTGTELSSKSSGFAGGSLTITKDQQKQYNKMLPKLQEAMLVKKGKFKTTLRKTFNMKALRSLMEHPKYDHSQFIAQLNSIPDSSITSVRNFKDSLNMILGIYNYGKKSHACLMISI